MDQAKVPNEENLDTEGGYRIVKCECTCSHNHKDLIITTTIFSFITLNRTLENYRPSCIISESIMLWVFIHLLFVFAIGF